MSYDFFDGPLNDKEFAERFDAAFKSEKRHANLDELEVNPVQMHKLNELIKFFKAAADNLDGKLSIRIGPMSSPNGVVACFEAFDLFGDELKRFCDVIRQCSIVKMSIAFEDNVCVTCIIPDVYIKKG